MRNGLHLKVFQKLAIDHRSIRRQHVCITSGIVPIFSANLGKCRCRLILGALRVTLRFTSKRIIDDSTSISTWPMSLFPLPGEYYCPAPARYIVHVWHAKPTASLPLCYSAGCTDHQPPSTSRLDAFTPIEPMTLLRKQSFREESLTTNGIARFKTCELVT